MQSLENILGSDSVNKRHRSHALVCVRENEKRLDKVLVVATQSKQVIQISWRSALEDMACSNYLKVFGTPVNYILKIRAGYVRTVQLRTRRARSTNEVRNCVDASFIGIGYQARK